MYRYTNMPATRTGQGQSGRGAPQGQWGAAER